MGGIGLWLPATSTEHHTHIRTYICTHIHIYAHTPAHILYMHLHNNIRTQFAHNLHTIFTQSAHRTQYAVHRTNREQTQSQQNSAHNYRTYSLDYYYEFAVIKNSNTIELYTILK